jgi:hypothetical protein
MNDSNWRSNLFGVPFGELTPVGLTLPENLEIEQWQEIGLALGRARGGLMWAVGDWWAFGEHRYGERAAVVKSDDWDGPAFGTCVNAATVCRRFETPSRDGVVSFRAHQAIAPIDDDEWRLKILAWAASEKPTFAALNQHIKEVKAYLAQGWTPDQAERKAQAEQGICVVANMHDKTDVALLAWAEANDRLVRVDRQTAWGNPFEMPDDGDRAVVVNKFTRFYLPNKNGLLEQIQTLRGKVLGCWCYPETCHGHVIAELVNRQVEWHGPIEELTWLMAEEVEPTK